MHNHDWLIDAAQRAKPGLALPEGTQISPDLAEAWSQLAVIFGLGEMELAEAVAGASDMPVGNRSLFQPHSANLLPEQLCRELGWVPLYLDGDTLYVATSDPRVSLDQQKRCEFTAGHPVRFVILPPNEIDTCQTRLFSVASANKTGRTRTIDLYRQDAGDADNHTVHLIKAIFAAALDKNASDIHIHPFVGGGAIRFRIDGLLQRIATIPTETLQGLSRFLRANAGLDANPFTPQDGRLRLVAGNREIDVRLSLLPAFDGDRIVCRLLDQGRNFSMQGSHLSHGDQQTLRRLTSHNVGMILLTGPTGSGKTSTLYSLLADLNRVDVNVMTIEDPVEYILPGISQIQVNEKQGTSFANTLRAILRQDPDIVLIGEIRDGETARIAAQAALTGHLVLSTLHTNDALGVLPRLLDLGLEPSIIADALIGVVSQRLVRRLCHSCRRPLSPPYQPHEEMFHRLRGEWPAYRPTGCPMCSFTGYQGRLPIIESIELSHELRQAVLEGVTSSTMLESIAKPSRRSMSASARDLIVSGLTTPAEVQRVIGVGFWHELAAESGKSADSLDVSLIQGARTGQRLQLLLLSADPALADRLRGDSSYEVEQVADEVAAATRLEEGQRAIALVIDTRICGTEPAEAWLTRLRTALAWSGLPALFLLTDDDPALRELLDRFAAPYCDAGATPPAAIAESLIHLLQGQTTGQ